MDTPVFAPRFVSRLTKNTLALVLAGGRGTRLKDLTRWRAKPAVPFGGKYRIIDFPLSNCVNSDIRRVAVLTQYKAHSLIQHIQKGWGYLRGEFGEFVEILPAQQRLKDTWYMGTADAVYQNLDIIRSHNPQLILILAGDHVYKMDYGPMLAFHVENNADLTIACLEVPVEEASAFGVMGVDNSNKVCSFVEKPASPESLPNDKDKALVSMGIYVFDREFLIKKLIEDADNEKSRHDFGGDIIPSLLDSCQVYAYPFTDSMQCKQAYWRDVGTVDSYWSANMELISVTPELNLYDRNWPIWTYQEQLPPGKFVFNDEGHRGMAVDSMISDGCILSGSSVNHSLLFNNVRVASYSRISNSVILPDVNIGESCSIQKAVIDKGTIIPDNFVVGENPKEDAERFFISDEGVALVTPESLGQNLHFSR